MHCYHLRVCALRTNPRRHEDGLLFLAHACLAFSIFAPMQANKRPGAPQADEPQAKRAKPTTGTTLDVSLFTELKEHQACVSAAKFSPDSRWLASVCMFSFVPFSFSASDKTVMIWDAETGKVVRRMKGHTGGINDVAWSDSRHLATASDDNNICTWDSQTGRLINTLRGHTNHVFCLKYNKGASLLYSGSYDKTIKIWDAKSKIFLVTKLTYQLASARKLLRPTQNLSPPST